MTGTIPIGHFGSLAAIVVALHTVATPAFVVVPRTALYRSRTFQAQHAPCKETCCHHLSRFFMSNSGDAPDDKDDDENSVFFEDFDFVIGGEKETTGQQQQPSVLQERIQEYQKEEIRKDARLAKNWRSGNWKVRGFSLDKTDPTASHEGDDESEVENNNPIHVSHLSRDASAPDRVAVARTDGSVCLIRLGTEYLAKFTSKLTAAATSNDDNDNAKKETEFSVEISSKLVRDEEVANQQEEDPEQTEVSQGPTPFEVTHQFVAHPGSSVSALLMEDDFIFTAGQSDIMVWTVPEDEDEKATKVCTLTNAHNGTVTSLKLLSKDDKTLLVSTATDGSFAVWNVPAGDLVFQNQVQDDVGNSASIVCGDVDKSVLFLGLTSGHVVGYVLDEVLSNSSPNDIEPSCRFLAYEQGGVSAIQCTGDGTLGRARPGAQSSILLTGGTDGVVKQWEMLSRTMVDGQEQPRTKLEHWPRMANQRMQKRAHLFKGHSHGPITDLASMDPSKFLSAGADGTVRAWNPQKGTELFLMDGFSEGGVTSLCLAQDMLITNGMESYVCVHDFDVTESEVEDGYELEW